MSGYLLVYLTPKPSQYHTPYQPNSSQFEIRENMKFTNIGADEKMRVPKSVKLDTSRKSPRYNSEYEVINALEFAESLINLKPRNGWELVL